MKKPIKLHWARSKPNFGDWLSPLIVECISGRSVEYAKIEECDLVAVGSLLQRLRNRVWNRRVHIWGAGFIEAGKVGHCKHYVHALRGPGSFERLGLQKEVPFGDPGLLVDRLLDGKLIRKRHRLSIIAHYKDKGSIGFKQLCEGNPGARILDVFSDPMELLKEIAASHYVLSSAMHGLIAADALEVPNSRVIFSSLLRGGDFKFCDYYQAFPVASEPFFGGVMSDAMLEKMTVDYQRPGLAKIKTRLAAAFPSL